MEMGETRASMRLFGPDGSVDVEMLVDTGSTLTKVPLSTARKIGLRPRHTAEVELADGRVVRRDVSQADAELEGVTYTVPLLIGPDGEQALLGLTTLEIFGLKVNPVTKKLEPTRFIEYLVRAAASPLSILLP